jgi:hypothetical protein
MEATKSGADNNLSVYCDLEGHTICGGTVLPNVLQTVSRPDLVLWWPVERKVTVVELMVPFESNKAHSRKAHSRKTSKYEQLVSDICCNIPCDLVLHQSMLSPGGGGN